MFGTIRKHQQWLWAIIITVIIISFVVFFSPNVGYDKTGIARANFGSIQGKPIAREEFATAYRESQLRYLFTYGQLPRNDDSRVNMEEDARTRLFLIRLIHQNKIDVSDEAAAQWLANAFRDRKQRTFRLDTYEGFVKRMLLPNGYSEGDLVQFAKNEVGIMQLVAIYGLSGRMVPPREAEGLYRREHEVLNASALVFPVTNFLASVTVNPTNIALYYTNRMSIYRLPERVQVSYVKFDLTNANVEADQQLAKETNLTQRIDALYLQQGPEAFTDTNGVVLTAEAAKNKIKEQYRKEIALRTAHKKAAEFASAIAEMPGTNSTRLDEAAAKMSLPVKITLPFGQEEGPSELDVPPAFAKAAFALNEEEPFSPPLQAADGFYVIARKLLIPSEVPPLDKIQDRVTEDYRMQQAMNIAREAGNAFNRQLTNALTQGKSFEAICAEAKVTPINLPPFSAATTALPELKVNLDFNLVRNLTADLAPGKASQLVPTRNGPMIVYLKSRTPVDDNKVKAELPAFLTELRQERLYSSFNSWISRQIAEVRLTGPARTSAQSPSSPKR
jgi:peptidyl-prolyl cis-trans isomerase D